MTRAELVSEIRSKGTFLCVGLDPEMSRLPKHLLQLEDPVFEFNKAIIDATRDLCVAYKPNTAFYECFGVQGWRSLKKTRDYIGKSHFTIADAKRGDIGNTSKKYAETFFEDLDFDAVTVAPYMGSDSVKPFYHYPEKWVILLGLTSNTGADDFQFLQTDKGERLFERVLRKGMEWGSFDNTMFVAGATRPEMIGEVRKIVPEGFLLIPGVGAQGGKLEEVARYGLNADVGLLVNVGRSILYADSGERFAVAARREAKKIADEMSEIIS